MSERELAEAQRLIEAALREDLDTAGDLTSNAVIPESLQSKAIVVIRQAGVVAGLPLIELIAEKFRPPVEVQLLQADGLAAQGTQAARLAGSMRSILGIERVMLNLVGRLSGVATMTRQYVDAIAGTKAKIFDTRKTTPGFRYLEKYAVRVGGGRNHRIGLFDQVLIKDNHLAAIALESKDPVRDAIYRARENSPPGTVVEIEVDNPEQLKVAIQHGPDIILLDNMNNTELATAVSLRDRTAPKIELEASGGVNLKTVRAIAETGVDRISVGALTHSAPCLDVALDHEAPTP